MSHQCVRCNTFYDEKAPEVIKGCPCGGKLFFFIKQEKLNSLREMSAKLTSSQKDQIEQDVREIVGESDEIDEPVVLDLETIRISQPGKYELDLVQLFKDEPLVYKIEEGKYVIDLIRSFGLSRKRN